jgi:hypothetical protein
MHLCDFLGVPRSDPRARVRVLRALIAQYPDEARRALAELEAAGQAGQAGQDRRPRP